MYKVYDYKCDKCGKTCDRLVESGTDYIRVPCLIDGTGGCALKRTPSKINYPQRSNPARKTLQQRRARNLGHDGGTSKSEGAYSHNDEKGREVQRRIDHEKQIESQKVKT